MKKPFKILLVDDSYIFGNAVRDLFKKQYKEVVEFTHLCTAEEIDGTFLWVMKNRPDLIFLDFMLEVGYGHPERSIQLYTDLVTSEDIAICPIFFVTGLLEKDLRLKLLEEKLEGVYKIPILMKPFDIQYIFKIVDACRIKKICQMKA
jgi:CheY-like chemotaxis protein